LVVRAQQQAPSPASPPAPAAYGGDSRAAADRNHQGRRQCLHFPLWRHQAKFVVTPAGVIATDPISLRRPVMLYGRRNMSS